MASALRRHNNLPGKLKSGDTYIAFAKLSDQLCTIIPTVVVVIADQLLFTCHASSRLKK